VILVEKSLDLQPLQIEKKNESEEFQKKKKVSEDGSW
jgi:hypothetical protein